MYPGVACQFRMEAGSQDVALSNGDNITNFLICVDDFAFRS